MEPPLAWVVVDDQVAGWVDYDVARPWLETGEVNIGYFLIASFRQKGYATRALELLLGYLSEETDYQVATLLIDTRNERSLAVARRARFEQVDDIDGGAFYFKRAVHGSQVEGDDPAELPQVSRRNPTRLTRFVVAPSTGVARAPAEEVCYARRVIGDLELFARRRTESTPGHYLPGPLDRAATGMQQRIFHHRVAEHAADENEIELTFGVDRRKELLDHHRLSGLVKCSDVVDRVTVSWVVARRASSSGRDRWLHHELELRRRVPDLAGCYPDGRDRRNPGRRVVALVRLVETPFERRERIDEDGGRGDPTCPGEILLGAIDAVPGAADKDLREARPIGARVVPRHQGRGDT